MMRPMRKTLARLAALLILATASVPASAQQSVPDEIPPHDARLEGFAKDGVGPPSLLMVTPQSGSAGAWFLTVVLGGLVFGVMCKGGKRTHLD